ncbi:MAG TPA: hypothetical protein PKN04_16340 [bacterium]|jgi:hypothetical protein|nr:hypothetical protein [bacterium]HNT67356.1 hypothetical protein [bacterium]
MEKIIKKYSSLQEQEIDDIRYWKELSGDEKLIILEAIRAQVWAIKDEHPERLQRVYRVIER